jgi:hypothetical protein
MESKLINMRVEFPNLYKINLSFLIMAKSNLNNKKFLFVTGSSGREKLMLELSKELYNKYSTRSHFLSLALGKTKKFFVSQGINGENVSTVVYDNKEKNSKPDMDFLRSKEEEYNINLFDIWQIAAPRSKKRLRMTYKEVLCWMEYIIRGIEKVVNDVKPDYAMIMAISGFQYVIAYKILMKKGVRILELTNARIPSKFTFDNDLTTRWPLLVHKYAEIKKKNLNEKTLYSAKKFVNNFRKDPFRIDGSIKFKESFSNKFIRYISYIRILSYRQSIPNLKPFFLYPIKDRMMKNSKIFKKPVKGEKYVLYFLQTHPEASTSVRGKWNVNQLALIENLAKSVPCDYKIYVKEHVLGYSRRPKTYHQEIKQHPQVRLISPTANAIDLIKNSSLVVTITGTIGWEAILLQKPVMTFGDVFYNVFDEIIKVKNISKLPKLVKDNLDKKIDFKKTLQFVEAVQDATFPGIAALPGDCQNKSLSKKNISDLVKGVELYCKKMNFV